ncbi:MAG: 7-cyano-7-deazaguanine synthase QueC [Bacteroidales bacterium]|nr:7-cyano-7-deazaguanine synthase QueC [Bacteroidales bacterium]
MEKTKAYVLLSGGQDSFVSLIWAMQNFESIEAVSVSYRQLHSKELLYAGRLTEKYKVPHFIYDIDNFFQQLTVSSLLNGENHNQTHQLSSELPASFVPNRNGIFLTIVATHAFRYRHKQIHLVTGVCQTDFSGYPDCRDNYIRTKALELSLGLDLPVYIHTPLMWKNKAETFKMAEEMGVLDDLIENTLSCYNGIETLHPWGRGCENCPACRLRKNGYESFIKIYHS